MNKNHAVLYVYHNILTNINKQLYLFNMNGFYDKKKKLKDLIQIIFKNEHYDENTNKTWYKPFEKINCVQQTNWLLFEIYINKNYKFLKKLFQQIIKFKKNIIFSNVDESNLFSNVFQLLFRNIIVFKIYGVPNYTVCFFYNKPNINGIKTIFNFDKKYELKTIYYKNVKQHCYYTKINDCQQYFNKKIMIHNNNNTLTQYCQKINDNNNNYNDNNNSFKHNHKKVKIDDNNNNCNKDHSFEHDHKEVKINTLTQYYKKNNVNQLKNAIKKKKKKKKQKKKKKN